MSQVISLGGRDKQELTGNNTLGSISHSLHFIRLPTLSVGLSVTKFLRRKTAY